MWALLAQAGFAIAGSIMDSHKANKAAEAQNVKDKEANLQNALETAQEIGSIQAQQGQLKDKIANTRAAASRAALIGDSSAENQAAGAGTRGASVDAVIQDIQRELGTSELDMERAAGVEQFNMQTRIKSLISNAKSGVYGGQKLLNANDILGGALAAGALSVARTYTDNYFKYGSGLGK